MTNYIKMIFNPDDYYFYSHEPGIVKVNYGCGNRKHNDEIGVDVTEDTDADYILNDDGKIPIESNSVDLVISRYVLEHVDDVVSVVKEISRILKPGKIFRYAVPHVYSTDAFDDPTHKQYFTLNTAKYFTGDANIHYSGNGFEKCKCYLRLTLAYPRIRIIRYPANIILTSIGYLMPRFSEQILKLPFLNGALYCELTKRKEIKKNDDR